MTREQTKLIARLIAEYGTGIIVSGLIKENVTAPTRIHKKIAVAVGAFALAGYATMKAGKYINDTIDELFDAYDKVKKELTK